MHMPTRKGFVPPNDKILRQTASLIDIRLIQHSETKSIIDKMFDIAYGEQSDRSKPILVGLAAPQVGISKRIILVDVAADGKGHVADLRAYINPEIAWRSVEEGEWYEGCYSTDYVCGIVSRPVSVKIKALDREGNEVHEKYAGYVARIFQHEIDHLEGKVFVDRVSNANNLHWVLPEEFPRYRDKEAWRTWHRKCSQEKWRKLSL